MFPRDHRFIDDLQIGDIYLGAKDSHLYEKISFRIWKRTYGSGQIEAEHFYSLAEFEITWLMLFFRFFRVKLHTGSGLFDLLVGVVLARVPSLRQRYFLSQTCGSSS